jgi:prepilin-type N-terminal cleavage/methylation domain-containing protein
MQSTSGGRLMKRAAFTLIELLMTIAIIAVLISLLLPALGGARETANIAYCLSNLSTLGKTAMMYMDDVGKPTQPWYVARFGYLDIGTVSEYSYGGFRHYQPNPDPRFSHLDTFLLPTGVRPYNKYIAPGHGEGSPIKTYICPSDKSWTTPLVGDQLPEDVPSEDAFSSWEVNGNSFAINWYWMQGPPWYGEESWYSNIDAFSRAGEEMLTRKVGGEAAKFVLFTESCMNYFMYDARPRNGEYGESALQSFGRGWHKKWNTYSVGYLDGHAEFRRVDTRYSDDTGFDIWPTLR